MKEEEEQKKKQARRKQHQVRNHLVRPHTFIFLIELVQWWAVQQFILFINEKINQVMTTQVVLYYTDLPITAPPDHIRAKSRSPSKSDLTAPRLRRRHELSRKRLRLTIIRQGSTRMTKKRLRLTAKRQWSIHTLQQLHLQRITHRYWH